MVWWWGGGAKSSSRSRAHTHIYILLLGSAESIGPAFQRLGDLKFAELKGEEKASSFSTEGGG